MSPSHRSHFLPREIRKSISRCCPATEGKEKTKQWVNLIHYGADWAHVLVSIELKVLNI